MDLDCRVREKNTDLLDEMLSEANEHFLSTKMVWPHLKVLAKLVGWLVVLGLTAL